MREWQRNNKEHLAAKNKARYDNDEEYRNKVRAFRVKYHYQAKERRARAARTRGSSNSGSSGSSGSTTSGVSVGTNTE